MLSEIGCDSVVPEHGYGLRAMNGVHGMIMASFGGGDSRIYRAAVPGLALTRPGTRECVLHGPGNLVSETMRGA